MPRMALCGGLRIGVDSSEPKMPPLVIVKVPPCRSATVILPSRAFLRQVGDRLFDLGEAQLVGVRSTGTIRPFSVLTATPML